MLGAELELPDYLARLQKELDRIDPGEIRSWSDLLYDCWRNERFVYIMGNGGSATTATHMAVDLGKNTLKTAELRGTSKPRLKVLSLTDNAGWIMAVANDLSYDQIFVQQLMNYGREGDALIAISCSGNSPNILNAVEWANRHGLLTFGLTGFDGGALRSTVRAGVHVQVEDMGLVESVHLCLFHWVLDDVYARINNEARYAARD